MKKRKQKLPVSLIILIGTVLAIIAGLIIFNPDGPALIETGPALNEAGRAKIIESLLEECRANNLAIEASLPQDSSAKEGITAQSGKNPSFLEPVLNSFTAVKTPDGLQTPCSCVILRTQFLKMARGGYKKFDFSGNNRDTWNSYLHEMERLGILVPGDKDLRVGYADCAGVKALYNSLESFFKQARDNKHNFIF